MWFRRRHANNLRERKITRRDAKSGRRPHASNDHRAEQDPTCCTAQSDVLSNLRLLGPLVLGDDGSLLLRREIIHNVESLADLLRRLALNHRGDLGAGEIQQRLDIHVVRRQDELEQQLLVNINELSIPLAHHLGHVGALQGLFNVLRGVLSVVTHVLDDLLQDGGLHVEQRDVIGILVTLGHGLDQLAHHTDLLGHLEDLTLLRLQAENLVGITLIQSLDLLHLRVSGGGHGG